MNWGCENIPYYSHSTVWKSNYAAKIPDNSFTRRKNSHLANCYISSFNSFLSSKHLSGAVSDFGARKKRKYHLKPNNSGSICPTPPRQWWNSPPLEALTRSNSLLPEHKKLFARGMLSFDLIMPNQYRAKKKKKTRPMRNYQGDLKHSSMKAILFYRCQSQINLSNPCWRKNKINKY